MVCDEWEVSVMDCSVVWEGWGVTDCSVVCDGWEVSVMDCSVVCEGWRVSVIGGGRL